MRTAAQAEEVVSDRRRHKNVPGYIPLYFQLTDYNMWLIM